MGDAFRQALMAQTSEDINQLLKRRTALIGEISKLNSGLIRNVQVISGLDILLTKNPKSTSSTNKRTQAEHAIQEYQSEITALELELEDIDTQFTESKFRN